MKEVEIFTDGACRGNPGPGGWGALLRYGEVERELYGGEAATTNNRMELQAAIEALRALKEPCRVALTTDSVYVKNGITQWLDGWKSKGWKTAGKKPVKKSSLLAKYMWDREELKVSQLGTTNHEIDDDVRSSLSFGSYGRDYPVFMERLEKSKLPLTKKKRPSR